MVKCPTQIPTNTEQSLNFCTLLSSRSHVGGIMCLFQLCITPSPSLLVPFSQFVLCGLVALFCVLQHLVVSWLQCSDNVCCIRMYRKVVHI